jgi:hypothetical protein
MMVMQVKKACRGYFGAAHVSHHGDRRHRTIWPKVTIFYIIYVLHCFGCGGNRFYVLLRISALWGAFLCEPNQWTSRTKYMGIRSYPLSEVCEVMRGSTVTSSNVTDQGNSGPHQAVRVRLAKFRHTSNVSEASQVFLRVQTLRCLGCCNSNEDGHTNSVD